MAVALCLLALTKQGNASRQLHDTCPAPLQSTLQLVAKHGNALAQVVLMRAGTENKHQVVLLSEAQLQSVEVQHDVGLLLAGLDLPDLLNSKDMETAAASVRLTATDASQAAPTVCHMLLLDLHKTVAQSPGATGY